MSSNFPIESNDYTLQSGSNICVVGGGPAGCFFTYFFLDLAERLGVNINVDIIEAKNFNNFGPVGCNHCGGIISESLMQSMATDGIILPSDVIRRGIDSYVMHTEVEHVTIETPLREKRIGSVFRGSGPMGSVMTGLKSFDKFLLDLCTNKGANIINDKVIEIDFENSRPTIKTKNEFVKSYDLVVGAVGLEEKSLKSLKGANINYQLPKTTKTYISEFYLGEELVSKHFGNSMHVFLMNIKNLEFAALIPKGHYVTLVILGKEIDKKLVEEFLKSNEVINCFPENSDLTQIAKCKCFPKINTHTAKYIYGDRFVAIGDSATSKLYKNGIGAAYITAKAAASAALLNGVSANDFEKFYGPTCNSMHFDNLVGKIVFLVTKIIKVSSLLKRSVVQIVRKEQTKEGNKRNMSIVLWDTFTGSATYREIFMRTLKPAFIYSLILNTIISIFKRKNHSVN